MTIYLIHFIINIALGLFLTSLRSRGNKRTPEKFYLLITFIQFGLLCGFRADSVGYDTFDYRIIFNRAPATWESILENNQYVEIGFSVFCSLIKLFGGSFQTMLIISSLFVMGSACIFVYRHSKNVVLSVFILISFPFFYSSFDIIRHFMATAFFLLGYKYVVERKFIKYVIFLFIGSLFHSIAWLFLPFYFMRKIKWNGITLASAFLLTVFAFLYMDEIALAISMAIGKGVPDGWVNSYGGGIKTAAMYLVIMCIGILGYYNQKNKTVDKACALNHIMILFIFSVIFINARMMTRLIMTSVPFMAIAVPELLCDKESIRDRKNNALLMLAFIAIGMVYHMFMLITGWQNIVPYVAYWQ